MQKVSKVRCYKAPPDSVHEMGVKEEDRSKGTGDPYVTLLTNQNCNGFNEHHTQHDGLEEEEEDCVRGIEREGSEQKGT